jgi:pSer/pThr/pTyr-binding forkhead associated (FHA) protein
MCSPKRLLFIILTALPFLLSIPPSIAETDLVVPPQYGEVIYRFNEKGPNQIFIIGISHRDALTCLNGDQTSRVQAEVYKIGDWLIHNQNLELLLPEGFFKNTSTKIEKKNIKTLEKEPICPSLDMKVLEQRLSDNKTYVNAEMLLKESHLLLRLRQVEDKKLYDEVRDSLFKLVSGRKDLGDDSLQKSELDYLQAKRTAAMLQKIPQIVNEEFQQGNIKSRKAIFTVGMYHIHEIIRYLDANKIIVHVPKSASNEAKESSTELKLLRENFGVSVILPRTLTDDQKILEINELDGIVKQYRAQSSPLSSLTLPQHP